MLKDIVDITTGKLNANSMCELGLYPFFTCAETPSKINSYAFDCEAILISGNGSQVGHINYYNGKFNAYQRTYILNDFKNIDSRFLYHFLKSKLRLYIFKIKKEGSVPYITLPMLEDFLIPLPPLEIQKAIGFILDLFDKLVNNLSEGLPAEIKLREQQYEYYRDLLLSFRRN